MNLEALIRRVGELRSPNNDRLKVDIKQIINQAIDMIEERHSWSFMRSHEEVVVTAGDTSAPLAENFKELTQERSPVSWTDITGGGFPTSVVVLSREEMQRRGWWPLSRWITGSTGFVPGFGIYIDIDGGIPTLNIPTGLTSSSDITFTVSGYYFTEDLIKASNHNALTDNGLLADAVVNLAKSIAYRAEDPADARGDACDAIYERSYKSALYADVRKDYAGRTLRA